MENFHKTNGSSIFQAARLKQPHQLSALLVTKASLDSFLDELYTFDIEDSAASLASKSLKQGNKDTQ